MRLPFVTALEPVRRSSRLQLIGLVALVLGPLLAAAGWIGWKQYEAHRAALGHTLVTAARSLTGAVDRELGAALAVVETLSHSPLIDEKRFDAFHSLASSSVAQRNGWWIVLFSPDGDQLVNTIRPYGAALPNVFEQAKRLPPPGPNDVPLGGAHEVRHCFETSRPIYGDLFRGQVSGDHLVAVSVPVRRAGKIAYCLTAALPALGFQPLVGHARFIESGAVIFDRRGFIVARADDPENFIGRKVGAGTLAVATSDVGYAEGTNLQGRPILRAVVRSPLTGWGAGVALEREAAFGAIWRSMRDATAAVLAILVLGMLAALRIGRLQAERREAQATSRAKDDFIATLSHELRNPVGAIALSAELMRHQLEPGHRARDTLERVARQAGQLRRLLDDLLEATRAIHGKLAVDPSPVAVRPMAQDVAAEHRQRAGRPVEIVVEGDDTWAMADPARLRQMLENLLENAVKYGARNIRVRVGRRGPQLEIQVADDGDGIAPELLPSLFEPFVQGQQPLDRSRGGLGLGLAMVKRLAELHGGSATAASGGPGHGSTFTLFLPACEAPAAAREPAAGATIRSRRFVVVDDNHDARQSLRALLAADGHEVEVAADGLSALERLSAGRADVALIDIGLPGIDGYEVARRLRASPAARGMTLIAITGYGQDSDRERALAAGFDAHLVKPFAYAELLEALRDIPNAEAPRRSPG